jgi:hypothetical protein
VALELLLASRPLRGHRQLLFLTRLVQHLLKILAYDILMSYRVAPGEPKCHKRSCRIVSVALDQV